MHRTTHYLYNFKSCLNNLLATKIKNLDGHMAENWTPI